MFIATIITAKPRTAQQFTIADSAFAHAAILSAITQADKAIGQALHNTARCKIFSCAILPSTDPVARIRMVLHTDQGLDFYQTMLAALNQSPILRLGRAICNLQGVDIVPSTWSGVASWADLIDSAGSQHITLRFVTPTAIMKTDGAGRRYTSLIPEPTDVFLGLQRRWVALGGPELLPEFAEILNNTGCIITRYQLQTTAFQAPERLQIGFCGSVTYKLRNTSPTFVQAICALARLAHFTGVGYQTTRGMGLVQSHIGP